MSSPVRGVLIAHGRLAEGMVDAVRRITGAGEDVLMPLSNTGVAPAVLSDEARARIGDGPAIIFTDLPSGSCGFAARALQMERSDVAVVAGVNLAMLLEFAMHNELPLEQLVPRLIEKGRAAVVCAPASLGDHADRAPSR